MLGYSQEETLQLHVWDWEGDLTPDQVLEMMRNIRSLPPTFESRHKRKDGSLFDVEISSIAVEFGRMASITPWSATSRPENAWRKP